MGTGRSTTNPRPARQENPKAAPGDHPIRNSADVPHFANAAEEAAYWPTADLTHLMDRALAARSRKRPRKAA